MCYRLGRRIGDLQAALDGLRYLASLSNLVVHADLIAGLPLYSLEQMVEDVRVLAGFGTGEIQLELLKLLPGTAMRAEAEALGIVYSPDVPYEGVADESDVGGGFASSPVVVSFAGWFL